MTNVQPHKDRECVVRSFNDFLWLALKVENGEEGLEEYLSVANFDNSKSMKNLYSKVLSRQKGMTTIEDF